MNKIFYSSLIVLSLFFVKKAGAQNLNFSVSPSSLCFDGTNPVIAYAAITSTGGATNAAFVFTVLSPAGCPQVTPVIDQTAQPPGSSVSVTYSCCGIYSFVVQAYSSGGAPTQSVQSNNTGFYQQFVTVTCPNSGAITQAGTTNSFICSGKSATLTATGVGAGATYTWSNGANTSSVVVSPTTDQCYSVVATSAAGCTTQAVSCVSVQATTVTLSPVSQTACAGNTVYINAAASSNSTGIQWFDSGGQFGTLNSQPVIVPGPAPLATTYTAIVSSSGPAGTCSVQATANVVTGTSISMSLTASASVCPGAVTTITASPSGATTYTFSAINPIVNPTFTTTSNTPTVTGPSTYSVQGDYQGCPGSTSIVILTAHLSPTLTATNLTNNFSCPGQPVNLQATGGFTYTFIGPNYSPPPTTVAIGSPSSTANGVVVTPTALPTTYTLLAGQGGCTGSTTLAIHQVTLHPHLTPNLSAGCPGSTFTLTATGGLNYTFTPSKPVPIGNITINTATTSIPSNSFNVTYTLVADSAGCKNFTTTIISLHTLTPTLSLASNSVCPNSVFTFTMAPGLTDYTFTAPPNYTINPIATNQATASIPTGSFSPPPTYTIVADSAGCTGLVTKQIGLLSLNNNITLVATPSLVCPNSQFTLVAGHAQSYTFTAPPTLNINQNVLNSDSAFSSIPSPTNILPPTYVYTVSADSAGCVGTRTTQVKQLFIHPTLSVTPSGSVCAGSQVTLTASSNNTAAPSSYTFYYSPPTGSFPLPGTLLPGNSYTATHHPTAQPTTYYALVDSSGCYNDPATGFATATIGILPSLSLTLTASTPTVCSGTNDTLRVNTVPNYTYTWFASSGAPVNNPVDTAAIINPTVNTTYTVHAVDQGGCVGDANITVNINPTASLSVLGAASPTTVCLGQPSTLTASGVNVVSYSWTPSSTLGTPGSATTIATPTAPTVYTVTGSNNLGCYGAATVSLTTTQTPTIHISAPSGSVCPGYNTTLTAIGAISYTWTGITTNTLTGGTTITPVYQQSIAVAAGLYTVIGSNGGSCFAANPATAVIAQQQPLQIQVSATPGNTTCITSNNPKYSKPVVLNATGASNYYWLPYNPAYMTYSLGPQTTVIPPATTAYTVIGYTSVCSGSGVVTVTVIPQFTMNVVPPLPAMCVGDSIRLNIVNIGTDAAGPASAFTYSWTEPDSQPLSLSDDFSPSAVAWPSATSVYSVEMRDSRDCVSLPRLVTVTVYPRPVTAIAIPTINTVATNTVCYVGANPGQADDVITLTGLNANVGLPFGVIPTYTWLAPSPYIPGYNSILTPANDNAVTVNAPLRVPSVVIYTLVSGYNGIPGCARYDTVSVRVIDCRPVTVSKIKFITDDVNGDTICTRQCVTFTSLVDTAAGGPQVLHWQFEGGNPSTSTDANPTVCYNLPNTKSRPGYNVILKVDNPYPKSIDGTSPGGSTATRGLPQFMHVYDYPSVTIISPAGIRSDTTVRFGQSVNLSGDGALSYQWYPPYNISSLTNPKVTLNPFQTTEYILTGYNSRNCFSSDTINVIVIQDCGEMFVPNAFSPNGDGHNDILFVRGICLQSLTFMVFNRWGEKVFETFDQKVGWNGDFRGEPENTGVFVYRLEGKTWDGKGFSSKGNVTLIR